MVMVANLTRLTHILAIQLHLVTESYAICSSRSRLPARKFWIHLRTLWKFWICSLEMFTLAFQAEMKN